MQEYAAECIRTIKRELTARKFPAQFKRIWNRLASRAWTAQEAQYLLKNFLEQADLHAKDDAAAIR